MTDIRKHAERLHTEARVMRLDPDQPLLDRALTDAGAAVVQRSRSLPPSNYSQGPWDVFAHLLSLDARRLRTRLPSYEDAVHMAALWTVLAAAVDRAEEADPSTGGEAA